MDAKTKRDFVRKHDRFEKAAEQAEELHEQTIKIRDALSKIRMDLRYDIEMAELIRKAVDAADGAEKHTMVLQMQLGNSADIMWEEIELEDDND